MDSARTGETAPTGDRGRGSLLAAGVAVLAVLLLAAKGLVASGLDLFGDEAFYWQCAQRPALCYVDHPPMTARLVGAGTMLLGDTTLGVRLPFLLIGLLFPLALYATARPLVGRRDALLAAGLSLLYPGTAHLGLVAIPDVPLLLWAVLFVGAFDRAGRGGRLRDWTAAGLFGALGLVTHLRFTLVPLGGALWLLTTSGGRRRLRTPGPWVTLLLLLVGSLPMVVFNLRQDLGPIAYYLGGRHGATFDPRGVALFVGQQLVAATPFLFVALVLAAVHVVRQARLGDGGAARVAFLALTPIAVFLAGSPFEDSGLTTGHWPTVGWVTLLPFVPGVVRRFAAPGAGRVRRAAAGLVVVLPAAVVVAALLDLGGVVTLGKARSQFTGWSEGVEETRARLRAGDLGDPALVVADNYKLGAHLEFALHDEAVVYVLDHLRNRTHGRGPQYGLWGLDEAALRERGGEPALVVVQASETGRSGIDDWMEHVAAFFDDLEEEPPRLKVPEPHSTPEEPRHVVFRFYRGRVAGAAGDGD